MLKIKSFLARYWRTILVSAVSVVGVVVVVIGEDDRATLPFVLSVFAALLCVFLLLSARVVFSILATWTILAVATAISAMKMKFMGVSLHAFDAYFYERDFEVIGLLAQNYLLPILICAAVLLCGFVISGLIWRFDIRKPRYRAWACMLLVPAAASWYLSQPQEKDEHGFYTGFHLTSSFFFSLKDVRYMFVDTPFVERLAAMPARTAYNGIADCSRAQSRPDMIVVLMKSAIRPSLYPSIKAPASLEASFNIGGQQPRDLRVETFGGGTWITTAGLMTSLPTAEFGWMRPYLPLYLQGRVHHSLPKLLKSCGYQTAVISPLSYPFVNEGPFMTSLGIDDYRDFKAIKAATKRERDRYYFNTALDYVARHRKEDGRPLFLFVMTMAAHGPFDFRFDPATKVPGEPFGNDAEMDEYLRRLTMQRMDYADFVAQFKKLPSREGALLVDFGDHQPNVTRALSERVAGATALAQWNSIAYRTYYSVTPVNMQLKRPLPDVPVLDIAYLGPTLLEVGGLPLDDVYQELIALRDQCRGSFMLCTERTRIERHLKKLANGGLLEFEPSRLPSTRVARHPGSLAR